MKRNLLIIFVSLLIISCVDKVVEFAFDLGKASQKTDYFYEYNGDTLIAETAKHYTLMFGQPIDSMIRKTKYVYDHNGLLIKEISVSDFEDNPSLRIFNYNSIDSLIQQLTISPDGDTTFWREYDYFADGQKLAFHRFLMINTELDMEMLSLTGDFEIKRDTIYERYKYIYEDDLCLAIMQYDKNGNLIKQINNKYNDDILKMQEHYDFIGDIKTLSHTTHFKPTINSDFHDIYDINALGDTIGVTAFKFDIEGNLSEMQFIKDYGRTVHQIFYSNGVEIGSYFYSKLDGFKHIAKLEYYPNGDLKSDWSYSEDLNAH